MINEKKLIEELYKLADEEIEKCKEAYNKKDFQSLIEHKYAESSYYKAIQKVKDMPKVDEWIPCSERLPKDKEEVIITDSNKNVRKITFNMWLYENPQYSHNIIPIAWMPLPEPYKE